MAFVISILIVLSVLEKSHISIRYPVSQIIRSVIGAALLLWGTRDTSFHKYRSYYWWQRRSLLSLAVFVSVFLDNGGCTHFRMSFPFMIKLYSKSGTLPTGLSMESPIGLSHYWNGYTL